MPGQRKQLIGALLLLVLLGSGALFWRRQARPEPPRPLSRLAERLNALRPQAFCDEQNASRKVYVSAVVDRFQQDIRGLWAKRQATGQPRFALLDLGKVQLRISPRVSPPPHGFDSSAWSWEDAYGLIQKTQQDPGSEENEERWRDLDSVVRYLLEKDIRRLKQGQDFLAPEVTKHTFRPNPSVRRSGPREFEVALDPGDFRGYERSLQRLLEGEWQGQGHHVRLRWVEPGPGIYRLRVIESSNRCFVNHDKRALLISNLAWTKTVAHELGHILGFDDHYYHVWHDRNCYYTQESRLGDLMSNSERGRVTARHWQLLEQAYPWRKPAVREAFSYVYGNE